MNVSQPTVAALRQRIQRLENARRLRRWRPSYEQQVSSEQPLSSGCPPLDQLLPGSGFPRGGLVEWLSSGPGGGAETLALLAAREAIRGGGILVVLDRLQSFYPPAAATLGIDLGKTILIRAARVQEEMWALDQALRCRGVAATFATLDQLDWRWFRRLQLAAEQGGGLGLLLRPARVRGQPSWSQAQVFVQSRPSLARPSLARPSLARPSLARPSLARPSPGSRRFRIELIRCQGSSVRGSVEFVMDMGINVGAGVEVNTDIERVGQD